jgi:hypothetical protein
LLLLEQSLTLLLKVAVLLLLLLSSLLRQSVLVTCGCVGLVLPVWLFYHVMLHELLIHYSIFFMLG